MFLEAFPAESREIALALRDWVWGLYPKCNELIYDNYNFLAFGWAPTDRMSDIFCSIAVGTRGVMFGFMWGVKLDDPKGLLAGGGNQFRSLRVPDIEKFPKADVKRLLIQAYELSVERLKGKPQTPNGVTITKSISEKKRRPGMPKKAAAARRERHDCGHSNRCQNDGASHVISLRRTSVGLRRDGTMQPTPSAGGSVTCICICLDIGPTEPRRAEFPALRAPFGVVPAAGPSSSRS